MTTLCASRAYNDEQSRQLSRIETALEKDLSFWFESSCSQGSKTRLQRDIIVSSLKVHLEMQCSSQKYEFIREIDDQFHHISNNDSSHTAKDISTWKTMTRDGTEDIFKCIYAGILVHDVETEEVSELVGPVVAVYKWIVPLQQRRSATSSSAKSSSRAEGLVKVPRDPKYQKNSSQHTKTFGQLYP